MKNINISPLIALALALLGFACSENKESANIKFQLTDMPASYDEINIDIVGVEVKLNDSTLELATEQGIYNLLELVNGKDTLLVDDEIPSGMLSQVRLILGEDNSIVVDGGTHSLKTPSAQQSGLKLNVHQEIISGESYEWTIDFVAEKSVVKTGKGEYILKPVLKVYSKALTGSVEGVINPADSRSEVRAIQGQDTSFTRADTLSGYFQIGGLDEGECSVEILPQEAYRDSILNPIDIVAGQQLSLDTLHLLAL